MAFRTLCRSKPQTPAPTPCPCPEPGPLSWEGHLDWRLGCPRVQWRWLLGEQKGRVCWFPDTEGTARSGARLMRRQPRVAGLSGSARQSTPGCLSAIWNVCCGWRWGGWTCKSPASLEQPCRQLCPGGPAGTGALLGQGHPPPVGQRYLSLSPAKAPATSLAWSPTTGGWQVQDAALSQAAGTQSGCRHTPATVSPPLWLGKGGVLGGSSEKSQPGPTALWH